MTKPLFTVTRRADGDFSATTDIALADGSFRRDGHLALNGNVLRSVEQRGYCRTGGLMMITLGEKSLAAVIALTPGQSVELGR